VAFILVTSAPTFAGSIIYVNTDAKHSENHQDYAPEEIIIKFRDPTVRTLGENTFDDPDVAKLDLSVSMGKLNKKFRLSGVKRLFKNFKAKKERIKALLKKDKALLTKREKHILQRLKRAPEKATVPALDRIYKLQFDLEPDESIQDVLDAYNNDPGVEYAELNYIVTIDSTPNDPYFPLQWSLHNTGQMYPESGKYNDPPGTVDADIDAPEAWDIQTGSGDIIVAVADTGVDYNHRDIDDNMWTDSNGYYGYDFANNDNYPMDDLGHGTHCAGTIAAEGNNGLDITGVCWNVKIMALKFLDESGRGTYADAAEAFYYAVNNGADVISNSWGKDEYSQTMQDAIDYANSQGVVIVASAGNDNQYYFPHYPASMDHVISVAATNSDDEKARYSNYGDWIDISAPGTDILSLRANGTSIGTTYDNYTTIASGTSMACPHVAGVIALLFSQYPDVSSKEIVARLLICTDDMSGVNPFYKGLMGHGRLNAYKALRFNSEGIVTFDREKYSCSDSIEIKINDFDIRGTGSQAVTLTTDGGDSEILMLTEEHNHPWIFAGNITTSSGAVVSGNGTLEVSHGQNITVSYLDPNYADIGQSIVEETVYIDCEAPNIFNVRVHNVTSSGSRIQFHTNEVTTAIVECGQSCGVAYGIVSEDSTPSKGHDIHLPSLASETQYFFVIEANDLAGNQSMDDNKGQCYSFITNAPPVGLHVPGEYPTIQEAIDAAIEGQTIWVADGLYTGSGNRDIEFKGKAITVRSENGPENCIIDCQADATDNHYGFYFNYGEDSNSVVDGFTITGAYNSSKLTNGGAGIVCDAGWPGSLSGSGGCRPSILNCIITGNTALVGGGIACIESSPVIKNCSIIHNEATYDSGGGIHILERSNPTITNCVISFNKAKCRGGGIHCFHGSPTIDNCLINCNRVSLGSGGGIAAWTSSSPTITNCTLSFNHAAAQGDGIVCGNNTHPKITNCIFWNNGSKEIERLIGCPIPGNPIVTYSDIRGGWSGVGNINADPSFVNGPDGDYYLSQIAAGQAVDSPCVDAGSDTATNLGMHICTTRTDQVGDAGIVDMGYHYPAMVLNPDIDGNWHVDLLDYAWLAGDWRNCSDVNLLPGDIVKNGCVDINDFRFLLDFWLDCYVTKAINPEPANEARVVDPKGTLSWVTRGGALYHDVYLGTDANAVANAGHGSPEFMGTVSEANFDPCGLEWETTYYWRINEVGPACMIQGEVWNFTTYGEPNFPPVGHWKFDEGEGTMAYDSAGTNNGTLNGDPNWSTGRFDGTLSDGAVSFDGAGDYVSVAPIVPLIGNTVTAQAWIRMSELAGMWSPILTQNIVNNGYYLYVPFGKPSFYIAAGPSYVEVISTEVINAGQWYCVAGTNDGSNLKLYIDGQLKDNVSSTGFLGVNNIAKIGGGPDSSYFNGLIDDVRIYDRALTAVEIEWLYVDMLLYGP
jgi:parallel beta-helix repeat protein